MVTENFQSIEDRAAPLPNPPQIAPPQGTVTFLFTDIEGSTRLLRQHSEVYPAALQWHREVLRAAAGGHQGFEVDTQGDSMLWAFGRTRDAVAAAMAAQKRFAAESFQDVSFRLRMGLHTGEPIYSGGFYVGLDVHRGARIAAASHGGQTVVSATTRELAGHSPAPGAVWRDLGSHQLKDFSAPVPIFQLDIDGLPTKFPPLRSHNPPRHNLQRPTRPLIGRDEDLRLVRSLFDDSYARLVTLTGPSGVGKTRLAQQLALDWAADLDADSTASIPAAPRFPDGVFWIALSSLRSVEEAVDAALTVLGVTAPVGEPETALLHELRARHLLLILDNCEQIENLSRWVGDLIQGAPQIQILVTSRSLLHLSHERGWNVAALSFPTLPLPKLGAQSFEAAAWRQFSALALFERAAREGKAGWQISPQTLPAAAQICALLDGLPLAIELAASRLKFLPLKGLAARLESSLSLETLSGGARDLPNRQQTMRGAIAWSYDLLSPRQQQLFCVLSVWIGGASPASVFAVVANLDEGAAALQSADETELFDDLCALAHQNLLWHDEGQAENRVAEAGEADAETGGESRFRLLNMVRRFAAEKLAQEPFEAAARRAHALYFAELVAQWNEFQDESPSDECEASLDAEYLNVTAALEWWLQNDGEQALQMAVHLAPFWEERGHLAQGRIWLKAALERAANEQKTDSSNFSSPSFRTFYARALNAAGALALAQGDCGAAREWFQRALTMRLESGTALEIAASHNNVSLASRRLGDYEASRTGLEESLRICREAGEELLAARVQNNLGNLLRESGENEAARALFQSSFQTLRRFEDWPGLAAVLNNRGALEHGCGDWSGARHALEEALTLQRRQGNRLGCALTLHELGLVAIETGEGAEARLLLGEALWTWRELGDSCGQILGVEGFACLAGSEGDAPGALRLAAAADSARQAQQTPRSPVEARAWQKFLDETRALLSPEIVARKGLEGELLGLKQAANEVLGA